MRHFTSQQVQQAQRNVNLLSLAATRVELQPVDAGEYRGPCPFCHDGKDRFVIFTESKQGTTHNGRFACRICGERGDGLQFLMKLNGWDFPTAVNYALDEPANDNPPQLPACPTKPTLETNTEADHLKMEAIIMDAAMNLPGNAAVLRYLAGRGIGPKQVGYFGLGYSETWHTLPGGAKVPPGLYIPRYAAGDGLPLKAVNVYLPKPLHEKYGRRRFVRGFADVATGFNEHRAANARSIWVTEGELDAALLSRFIPLHHEAITWGGVNCYPADTGLLENKKIYLCFDNDKAWQLAMEKWHFLLPYAHIALPTPGHDLTDMYQAGVDLGAWVYSQIDG